MHEIKIYICTNTKLHELVANIKLKPHLRMAKVVGDTELHM